MHLIIVIAALLAALLSSLLVLMIKELRVLAILAVLAQILIVAVWSPIAEQLNEDAYYGFLLAYSAVMLIALGCIADGKFKSFLKFQLCLPLALALLFIL